MGIPLDHFSVFWHRQWILMPCLVLTALSVYEFLFKMVGHVPCILRTPLPRSSAVWLLCVFVCMPVRERLKLPQKGMRSDDIIMIQERLQVYSTKFKAWDFCKCSQQLCNYWTCCYKSQGNALKGQYGIDGKCSYHRERNEIWKLFDHSKHFIGQGMHISWPLEIQEHTGPDCS